MSLILNRPPRPLFSRYNLAQLYFILFGIPKNSFGSVDVTNDCNLRCDHCYFFEQDHSAQWSLEEWRAHFDKMKADGFRFFQCAWVGGEPLMRPEIIELGRRYFRYNTVTTNGSLPLPDWKDVSWYISVDGNREHHERMRNSPGLYETINRTIGQSKGLKITIAYCITSENYPELAESIDEWSANPKVRNMVFSFFTPVMGIDDSMWLGWEERDRVIDLLLEKRRRHGDFIVNTPRALRLMKSDRAPAITENCPFAERSFAFGPSGKQKKPCMLGPKTECERCGCVVPFYLSSLMDRKLIVSDLAASIKESLQRLFVGRP